MINTEKTRGRVRNLVLAALAAAATFILTYLVQIPVGFGYVHAGDAAIFVFAVLLPTPYAVLGGAIGASLADLTLGYAVYIPATFIIKTAYVLFFTSKTGRILCVRNLLAPLFTLLVCVGGYYLYEGFIYGFAAALPGMVSNTVQIAVATALFYSAAIAMDAGRIKRFLK